MNYFNEKLWKPIIDVIPLGEKSITTGFHEIKTTMAAKPDQIWMAGTTDEDSDSPDSGCQWIQKSL